MRKFQEICKENVINVELMEEKEKQTNWAECENIYSIENYE